MKIMKKKKISKEQIFKKMQELAGPMGDFVTQFSEKMGKNIEERKKRDFMMGIQHVLIDGMAHYDDYDKFLFNPDHPVKDTVVPFRGTGVGQLLSDGTFDFIRKPRLRAQSKLIKKLAHGRVSKTKDGAIQLTLKVFQDEGINISEAIAQEALQAKQAIIDWQMKGGILNVEC